MEKDSFYSNYVGAGFRVTATKCKTFVVKAKLGYHY
jgi:hypothetical protein